MDNPESPFEKALSRLHTDGSEKITPSDWEHITDSNEHSRSDYRQSADPRKPLSRKERLDLAKGLHDQLLIRAATDLDGLMSDGSSQLNKILDLTKELVASDANDLTIDKLTINRMNAMSDDDLAAAALAFLATLPGDDYKAIWRRFIGLSDDALQAEMEKS